MPDDTKPLRATREYRAESFEDAIRLHAEKDHTLIMCVYVTPEGGMEVDLDKNAESLISNIIEQLQAMQRALAN